MKYAILADVHSNIEALDAVLAAADAERVDRVIALGDLVGYHADPNPCIERLRERKAMAIAGNHDRAATGRTPLDHFNETARRAIEWTRTELTPDNYAYLASLPITAAVEGRFLLFHAALHPAPDSDLHLTTTARVERSFDALLRRHVGFRVAFFGHTHQPVVHERKGRSQRSISIPAAHLDNDAHYLVNPGSVGQSRDGDPRASFLIFDGDEGAVRFLRVPYDRAACLSRAVDAGLLAPPRASVECGELSPEPRSARGSTLVSEWFATGIAALRRRVP